MENEEKGILVEQVVQADRIRTHGKFHERLFLLLRIIYFLIGMLGVVLGLALTYEIELNYVLLVVGTIVIGLLITAAWELPISRMITWPNSFRKSSAPTPSSLTLTAMSGATSQCISSVKSSRKVKSALPRCRTKSTRSTSKIPKAILV